MTPDEFTNQEFFLDVGDGHQIYVQDWGQPDAKIPIVFLHGGPGAGCSDKQKSLFDPNRQRVIFHDQRGSGKSLPYGSVEHNTTQDLVHDIHKLVTHLHIKKFVLTGGSWGSCLALVYAIHYPNELHALVLKGIFTGTTFERDWVFKGSFMAYFPDIWETYVQNTPKAHHKDPTAYHLQQIVSGNEDEQKRSAYVYGNMEYGVLTLDDRVYPSNYEDFDPTGMKIEAHYAANKHWLKERFVLNNAHKLNLPVFLVQGRYDMICPPFAAYDLNKVLPQSELIWTIGGHSGSDRANYDVTRTILLQSTRSE